MFNVYFQLGWRHIADLNAYDHILFIVALCAIYKLMEWKQILVLVTAFTVGHSITLAMVALDVITINSSVIEFLIPVTIFLTALYNIIFVKFDDKGDKQEQSLASAVRVKYLIALFFGLIHGMGFSNYFRSLLGQEANITLPLFAFNVGLEAGQLLIVAVLLAISALAMNVLKVKQKYWNYAVSGFVALLSIRMMIDTFPF